MKQKKMITCILLQSSMRFRDLIFLACTIQINEKTQKVLSFRYTVVYCDNFLLWSRHLLLLHGYTVFLCICKRFLGDLGYICKVSRLWFCVFVTCFCSRYYGVVQTKLGQVCDWIQNKLVCNSLLYSHNQLIHTLIRDGKIRTILIYVHFFQINHFV